MSSVIRPPAFVAEAEARAETLQQNQMPDSRVRAQEAVSFAKDRGFEREAVTDEREIMRDALRRGMETSLTVRCARTSISDTLPASFRPWKAKSTRQDGSLPLVKRLPQSGRLSAICNRPEYRRADHAERAGGKSCGHLEFLNPAQRRAIEEVLTSQDRVHGLQGLAGTGKTTTLEAIREGAEQGGYAVEGFAPTSRAAAQLRDAGISAETLQSFLVRGSHDELRGDPSSRHLYMVDESSLASTRQMQAFMEKIGPQDRVLLIGDTRQHQSVDAGKPFEQMQQAGMQTSQLDQIMRQKDPGAAFARSNTCRRTRRQSV